MLARNVEGLRRGILTLVSVNVAIGTLLSGNPGYKLNRMPFSVIAEVTTTVTVAKFEVWPRLSETV